MAFTDRAFSLQLLLLISSFLIQTAISATPLFSICSNSHNFTANSPYEKNLIKLLGELYFKTPPTGFGLGSSGQGYDRAYGLSLCRGDVSTKDCGACVVDASDEIIKRCPNDRGAIIWYDNCLLKYADSDFLGKIDGQNRFYMWNLQNVTIDPQEFNQRTRGLLSELSEHASKTGKMYAKGEVEVTGYEKIYGMAQCSRDLSGAECKKCLDDAVNELPRCCGGKQGGRVVGGSCNIRYEIYPFLNL
ncbi:cysteine-rich repeat secretory protein 38 [Sesamum indicum]|uniref:Cysteine-rich repeat secretory protein 38 n=1 Tax=Sesamum indicum TaxID=4182 RepID=A0A6I9T5C8_SESIN|nr:cysteine-rich repeat secretory protein 38 [Sesamum indicum]